MKALARLAFAVAVLIVVAAVLFTPRAVTRSRPPVSAALLDASTDHDVDNHRRVSDGAAVDLYGNEVTDAIATYSLDTTGSLYELHSPQTELPKLGSPKS